MILQWDGNKVDQWIAKTGKEPTRFVVCEDCWDFMRAGIKDADKVLKPEHGDPQDKYLYVVDEESTGNCDICHKLTQKSKFKR